MKIPLLKCHGSGNDFILIDELDGALISEQHRGIFAQDLCTRNTGFGADGVLYVVVAKSAQADCMMRMYNPDGSEAKMCGNGLRCVARYYCNKKKCQQVCIETESSIHQCGKDTSHNSVDFYRVQIGPVDFEPETLPMNRKPLINQILPELDSKIQWYAVSITNPHLLAVVEERQLGDISLIGQKANNLDIFPQGVNCSLIHIRGDNQIFVTTYERGAGLTHSCGTAMSASSFIVVYSRLCSANKPVQVHNKGTMVICTTHGKIGEMVWTSGNATFVYTSECSYNKYTGRMAGETEAYRILQNSTHASN